MEHLPPGFAEDLAQLLEPSHRGAAADIIAAATALDDDGLRTFLDLFGQRVRGSQEPITHVELQRFLVASRESRQPPGL